MLKKPGCTRNSTPPGPCGCPECRRVYMAAQRLLMQKCSRCSGTIQVVARCIVCPKADARPDCAVPKISADLAKMAIYGDEVTREMMDTPLTPDDVTRMKPKRKTAPVTQREELADEVDEL